MPVHALTDRRGCLGRQCGADEQAAPLDPLEKNTTSARKKQIAEGKAHALLIRKLELEGSESGATSEGTSCVSFTTRKLSLRRRD